MFGISLFNFIGPSACGRSLDISSLRCRNSEMREWDERLCASVEAVGSSGDRGISKRFHEERICNVIG